MSGPVDVVIAVPARDEAERISACLLSVIRAAHEAKAAGAIDQVIIAVAADRCRDRTAELAKDVLADASQTVPSCRARVWEITAVAPVGAVRSWLINQALPQIELSHSDRSGDAEPVIDDELASWWIFSTDADSVVPIDWIVVGLQMAAEASAAMVVGLIDLNPAEIHPQVLAAHDQLIKVGMHDDGSHDHVYAANLAVRADAYAALGGFPAVIKGEEQALLDAARCAGLLVLTSSTWKVRTSARLRARAHGGLGDLLSRIAEAEDRGRLISG